MSKLTGLNSELFTLETLAKFYTDAAKAGGMECWYTPNEAWLLTSGPNLDSVVKEYRPKPAQPIVRWLIRFDDETTHHLVFYTEEGANLTKKRLIADLVSSKFDKENVKVIKLVEEQA